MSEKQKVLLLVGSPKNSNSSSHSIGKYLVDQLNTDKFDTEVTFLYNSIKSEDNLQSLLKSINECDLLVFSFPLYFDTLPAGVIKALEYVAARRQGAVAGKNQKFFIIANSGYPEKEQNDAAIKTCEIFAKKCGFELIGKIAIGAGTIINGANLDKIGFMSKKLRRALETIASSISQEKGIPEKVMKSKAKLALNNWGYVTLMHCMFLTFYKKNGILGRVKERPYASQM